MSAIKTHDCKACKTRWLPVVLKEPKKPGGPPTCPRCGGDAPPTKPRHPVTATRAKPTANPT
jgi:NAD-dependent SIR2 family protein deacetylase